MPHDPGEVPVEVMAAAASDFASARKLYAMLNHGDWDTAQRILGDVQSRGRALDVLVAAVSVGLEYARALEHANLLHDNDIGDATLQGTLDRAALTAIHKAIVLNNPPHKK